MCLYSRLSLSNSNVAEIIVLLFSAAEMLQWTHAFGG